MEQKIRELTEKIYQEGVEKGEQKAGQIIKESEKRAAEIISEAKAEAEKIIEEARRRADELKKNTDSELKISTSQAIASIKNSIVNLVTAKILDEPSGAVLSDPSTLKEFIARVIENWKVCEGEVPTLELLLPAEKRDELDKNFNKSISGLLSKGLEVTFSKNIKSGFRIGPADGTFKISFTDEDFGEFFKEYLKPRTRSLLFGE